MWGFIGWKAAGFPSTPHSTQFKFSTPPTLDSLHNAAHWGEKWTPKAKLKESKVFTCWILLLLWTRLRAWGMVPVIGIKCELSFLRGQDMEKHRRARCQRKYYSSPAIEVWTQSCDGKGQSGSLWQLPVEMLHTHDTVKVHYLFPHNPFKSFQSPTAAMLPKYIKRWLWFVCIWVRFPMSPSISQWFCWTHNSSLFSPSFLPRSLSLSAWPRRDIAARTQKDETHRVDLRSKCVVISFISKYFTFPLKMNVSCQVTFKCKGCTQITNLLYSYISCESSKRSVNHK